MQLADVYKYGVMILLGYFVLFGLWRMFPMKYEHYSMETMSDIARRSLSVVGSYDDKFTNSLRFLLDNIYQKLYYFKKIPFADTREMLLAWRVSNTHDPSLKIETAIIDACSDLEKRWENYEELNRVDDAEPFTVNLEDADLPLPASTLRCNDHIDVESLHTLYYNELKEELV